MIILNQLLTTLTLTKSSVFFFLPSFLSELVESRATENRILPTPLHFPFPSITVWTEYSQCLLSHHLTTLPVLIPLCFHLAPRGLAQTWM